jgi:GntR family transcriptional regulator, transcriptional repressor for pyruvate dehydrogenase complex
MVRPLTTPRFQPIQSRRIFEEILAQIEDLFASGQLVQGDRLPPERDLAEQFGTSRTSVREAMRVLEALGVVEVKPGGDNGAVLVTHPARAFRDILQYQLALRHIDMPALVEFRIVLESWTAGAAAERREADALERLGKLLAAMAGEMPYTQFQEFDSAFHLEIARVSGNDLFALTLEGARTTIERAMLEAMAAAAAADWPSTHARLVEEHDAILEAIATGDSAAATGLMTAHIRDFYDQHLFRNAEDGAAPVSASTA